MKLRDIFMTMAYPAMRQLNGEPSSATIAQLILNLVKMGLPFEQIVKSSGLSQTEIEELRKMVIPQ